MKKIKTLDHLEEETKKIKVNPRLALVAADDESAIKSVIEAAKGNIVDPVFIGNEKNIKKICVENYIDIRRIEVINEPDHKESVYCAVNLFKKGRIDMIMKGLVSTGTLLRVILDKERGMPPDGIISHVGVCYLSQYGRFLFVTDAGVNINPNLSRKIEIIKNAVDLAKALGIKKPKVAMLAAIEKVNLPVMPATLDAALLARMSGRGPFKGAIVGGPFALDNALSIKAADYKGIHHPVAGEADIVCVPDIESGNVLYKAITVIAGLNLIGIVLGSKIPLVVTSRSDTGKAKYYSIVLGAYYSHIQKQKRDGKK